jgi:nucleotide-binding universal stress UspA family protein
VLEIKTILCPVDFSDFSRHALAHAIQLARWFDSALTVLHVYLPPAPPPPMLFGGLPGPLPPTEPFPSLPPERAHEAVLARLSEFTAAAGATGVALTVAARAGTPAGTILDEAGRLQSDLIVLGTHGHSGFERWMLGSVTEKVLRKAPCPVLTVPPQVGEAPDDARRLFKRILCAIDFSEASLKGLEYALSLAQEADAALVLMHVIEGLPEPPDWQTSHGPAVAEYLRLSEQDALRRLRAAVPHDASSWCQPEIIVRAGKPYQAILAVAQEHDCHLIVMGVHGRNPLDRLFFGSTTTQVVRTAATPVLTVKGR